MFVFFQFIQISYMMTWMNYYDELYKLSSHINMENVQNSLKSKIYTENML